MQSASGELVQTDLRAAEAISPRDSFLATTAEQTMFRLMEEEKTNFPFVSNVQPIIF